MLRHANLLASVEAVRVAWRWTPEDRLVLALPLFHVHGLGVGINGTLHAGASAVLLPRFDADAVLDAVAAHDATLFFGVPTMYDRLAALAPAGGAGPACGSACRARRRCPPSSIGDWPRARGLDVLERYGMSETLMNVSNPVDGRAAGRDGRTAPARRRAAARCRG